MLRDHYADLSPQQLYAALVLTGVDKVKADYERSKRALQQMQARGA